jgi:hypothetical protein
VDGCLRCKGFVWLQSDEFCWFWRCINCGWQGDYKLDIQARPVPEPLRCQHNQGMGRCSDDVHPGTNGFCYRHGVWQRWVTVSPSMPGTYRYRPCKTGKTQVVEVRVGDRGLEVWANGKPLASALKKQRWWSPVPLQSVIVRKKRRAPILTHPTEGLHGQ